MEGVADLVCVWLIELCFMMLVCELSWLSHLSLTSHRKRQCGRA